MFVMCRLKILFANLLIHGRIINLSTESLGQKGILNVSFKDWSKARFLLQPQASGMVLPCNPSLNE